jgi:glucose/arabinose dehydrogenase
MRVIDMESGEIRPSLVRHEEYLSGDDLVVTDGGDLCLADIEQLWCAAEATFEATFEARPIAMAVVGLAVAPDGALLVAACDAETDEVVRVDEGGGGPGTGDVATIAGGGELGDGALATDASVSCPTSVAVAPDGTIVIGETGNNRVRRVRRDGTIVTIAGSPEGWSEGFSGDGGDATEATFRAIADVEVDAAGNVYVLDQGNDRLRLVDPDGTVTTIG